MAAGIWRPSVQPLAPDQLSWPRTPYRYLDIPVFDQGRFGRKGQRFGVALFQVEQTLLKEQPAFPLIHAAGISCQCRHAPTCAYRLSQLKIRVNRDDIRPIGIFKRGLFHSHIDTCGQIVPDNDAARISGKRHPPLDRWRIEIKAMIFIGFPQAASMSVNSYCIGWFKTTVLA